MPAQPDSLPRRAARLLARGPARLTRRPPAGPSASWPCLGAALMVWSGVIHLQLWSDGYRTISVIGPLFLIQGIGEHRAGAGSSSPSAGRSCWPPGRSCWPGPPSGCCSARASACSASRRAWPCPTRPLAGGGVRRRGRARRAAIVLAARARWPQRPAAARPALAGVVAGWPPRMTRSRNCPVQLPRSNPFRAASRMYSVRIVGTSADQLPDESLLAGLGAGDAELSLAFVRRFQRIVFGVAMAVIGDTTHGRGRRPAGVRAGLAARPGVRLAPRLGARLADDDHP